MKTFLSDVLSRKDYGIVSVDDLEKWKVQRRFGAKAFDRVCISVLTLPFHAMKHLQDIEYRKYASGNNEKALETIENI